MTVQSYYQPVKPLTRSWYAHLNAIKGGSFGSQRYTAVIEPEELSVLQRQIFETNPDDFEFVASKIDGLPDYLTKYFVKRYVSIFNQKGRFDANTFLRNSLAPAAARAQTVLAKYKHLPTTQKVAILSKEIDDDDPFHDDFFTQHREPSYQQSQQISFDFERAEQNHKPVKTKILAELDTSEIKAMAWQISLIVNQKYQQMCAQFHAKTALGTEMAVVFTYEQLAIFAADNFGIKPPRKYKEQSELSALQDISKLTSQKWWARRLMKVRKIMREHLAIAMGQVSSKASPYASWECVSEHEKQQKANYKYLKQHQLLDEETGEEADLWDMVKKSVSNPAIRRHELMVRCRGCEDIGNELGLQGLFLTLTTPSKYHNSYKRGGFIDHWNGASPRDAQTYLNNVWQRIRAKLGRKEIRWFGVRVTEPHHDGTPHWHLLIWVKPEDKEQVTEIFVDYATKEDEHELFDKQGKFDHSPRCDVGEIDPEKGTATGYIAKYISKNIDGYAMDDAVSDETGKPVKDMAKNVSAWKSRWNIRQFQFFGGAPVTTYRELRRFANQNKKAFMEYLFMQERVDLLTIYSMLMRDLVGPIKPSKLITNQELVKVIGDSYQARGKSDKASVAGTLAAADHGNWQGYIMGQGGPFVKREDLLIVNSYEVLPFASPHGEDVRKIEGFATPDEMVKTRTKVWTIVKKSAEAETCALGSEATALGGTAASRSSVNNCTDRKSVQISNQLNHLLEVNKNRSKQTDSPPDFDPESVQHLLNGSSLRLDDETSVQIRAGYIDNNGNKHPPQLVEVHRRAEDSTNWLDFKGFDHLFAQSEQPDQSDDWPII